MYARVSIFARFPLIRPISFTFIIILRFHAHIALKGLNNIPWYSPSFPWIHIFDLFVGSFTFPNFSQDYWQHIDLSYFCIRFTFRIIIFHLACVILHTRIISSNPVPNIHYSMQVSDTAFAQYETWETPHK